MENFIRRYIDEKAFSLPSNLLIKHDIKKI